MGSIGIVTDSYCGLTREEAEELGIFVLPMPFYVGGRCYYENTTLTRDEFFKKLADGEDAKTSSPSPLDMANLWDEALKVYDQILFIPISSGLSGTCEEAQNAALSEQYEGKVFVVDNGRISIPMLRSIYDAQELIKEGYSAEVIKDTLERYKAKMDIFIAVETLEYLKKGGRIKPAVAMIGSVLNIKPVLRFDIGTLDVFKKCRGMLKAKKDMIEAVKEEIETRFKEEWERGEVYLLAAASATKEVTEAWVEQIKEAFPGKEVLYGDLPIGACCHIGPGGLGIGFSVKPVVTEN